MKFSRGEITSVTDFNPLYYNLIAKSPLALGYFFPSVEGVLKSATVLTFTGPYLG